MRARDEQIAHLEGRLAAQADCASDDAAALAAARRLVDEQADALRLREGQIAELRTQVDQTSEISPNFIKLFKEIGDLGIKPLFFPSIGFNVQLNSYEILGEEGKCLPIDGTSIRDTLKKGEKVPDWKMREIIQDVLIELESNGEAMFVETK